MPVNAEADEIGNIFGFPSEQSFRAGQLTTPEPSPSRRPEVPLNLGFGAGGMSLEDFLGFNPGGSSVGDLSFNYSMPGFGYTNFSLTPGAGVGYGGGLVPGGGLLSGMIGGGTPQILDRFTVSGGGLNELGLLNFDPNAPYLGPQAPFQLDPTSGGAGVVTLPKFTVGPEGPNFPSNLTLLGYNPDQVATVTANNAGAATGTGPVKLPQVTVGKGAETTEPTDTTTPSNVPDWFRTNLVNAGLAYNPTKLPAVKTNVNTDTKTDKTEEIDPNVPLNVPDWFRENLTRIGLGYNPTKLPAFKTNVNTNENKDVNVDIFQTATNKNAPRVGDLTLVDDTTTKKKDDSTKVDLGGGQTTATGGGSTTTTGTGTSTLGTGARRNIGTELKETMAALKANQPAITGMYKDLYESFMPETLRTAASSGLAQLRADEEKLARLRAGILSPEDVRTAQQGAREAYAARGQVMGPGAVGAEILNRENIRQAREDAARAAYQQSVGNILNTANLQTGNIFQPIGNLISGTFNPLGSYPADVYGTNVNADLAREIAQKNYEAAIESARLGGAAASSAAKTSVAGQIGAAALPAILTAAFCWVAREVYGENNPKWMQFRTWMFTQAPGWFFRWYMDNGEKFAEWLKRHPWAKPGIRFWMDSRIRSMEKQITLREAF